MAEFKDPTIEKPHPEKPRRSPLGMLFWVLIGILTVLILANLEAILKPIKALNEILTPIAIGLVLAYLCSPILRFFELKAFYKLKRTVNRALSMLLTYVVLLLIIAGIVWLILPQLIESINDFRINGMFYVNRLITSLNSFIASLPFDLPDDSENIISLEKLLTFAMQLMEQFATDLVGRIGNLAGSALTLLKNILVGIFVSIYVLLSKDRLKAGCRRAIHALFSETNGKMLIYYTGQANRKFGGFIVGKLVDSLMVGVTAAILFTIFKIPYAILIAVIIGVTDFIPFFGPFIGAIPSAVIIFIADPTKAILFVILILVIQQIDGNLLAPLILGDHTGLTSLGVLVAITVMGGLFGLAGMVIGVPLFALIMMILDDYIKHRLRQKGSPTDLYSYYAADAFIRPSDEAEIQHNTLTQKFVLWIAAVEEEMEADDYNHKGFHHGVNMVRLALLNIGKFFRRIFSTKQSSEDYRGSQVNTVLRRGMRANRSFLRVMLLTVVTLGIYHLYLLEVIAINTNISCSRDGKRSWGLFPVLMLGIVTLGIFPLIWRCQLIARYREYAEKNGQVCPVSVKDYALWSTVGIFTLVGPFIAYAHFLNAYNQSCRIFNETHTFPLPRIVLEEEAAEGAAYLAAKRAAKAADKAAAFAGDPLVFDAFDELSETDDQISAFEAPVEEAAAGPNPTEAQSAPTEDAATAADGAGTEDMKN